jgi:CHAT domain-containing protein
MNLAEVYTITKNYTKANDEIEKAIYLVKNQNNHQDNLYIQCVVKYCNLKAIEKDYNSSNQLLLALIQENKHHDNDYIADAYHQLGCNYLAQKNFKEAIKNFETANKIYQQFFGDKNVYSIDPLTEISNAYLQENKPSEALKYALLALAQTEENAKTIYPYDHWECIVQILKCKKEMYVIQPTSIKNYKEDIDLIKQTISEAKTIKQTYYTNGSQMHYAEKMSQLHMLGIFYLTHFYKKIDAYFLDNLLYFSDNNKANLLRYKISSDASTEILPTNESNKLHAITDKLNYFIALNENQANVAFNLNDSIFYYQNKHELFTKYIEQKYPKVYAIKYGQKSFTAKEIQDKLKENYTFLNYCNDGENYYCLSISTQNINYKICGNKSKIDTLIKTYQTNLINLKFNNALNKELSQYLLPKTLNKNLLIATDEMLQDISFDVLHENATNNYLIYNHSIQYTFSASTYFKHQTITQNKSTIAFFPNFINTKYAVLNYNKENKSLQAFANYSKFQDSLATKKSFLEVYKKANVIHIASHLIIDTLFPLHSSLLFQSNNDCALTINDIWKLNANMQLITLAACYSNFGKTQNGEGMQNFVWAFQYAGAHNVLSTQWNASDKSTANIISQFYAELRKGKSKEEALRLSKINYLEQADAIGIQPFFWANYCLFADETDIKIKSHFITSYWWLICVATALFISIYYVRQQIKK